MAGVLPQTKLVYDGKKLILRLPAQLEALNGEILQRRLRTLAKELAFTPEVQAVVRLAPQKSSFLGGLLR
jgi:hypothetical protein